MIVVEAVGHAAHAVASGLWCGRREPTDELPARAEAILAHLRARGAPVVPAAPVGLAALHAVHDPALLALLETAHARWVAEGHLADGPDAIPYLFPAVAGRFAGRAPTTIRVALGRFATDTMTPIGPGTWSAVLAAAHAAATAADLVAAGAPRAYAACRPPGHHAGRAFFGGSCYANHAAVAVERLRAAGARRLAVLDLDAHHGNGTQAVYWDDPDVLVASAHVDPAAGWYPHTVGWADEVGPSGTNLNRPLPPGTGDAGWVAAVGELVDRVAAFGPDALVVSLGVDAAAEDPNAPLEVTDAGFRAAGARVAALGRPTVYVQEGGYVLDTLGPHVASVLGLP